MAKMKKVSNCQYLSMEIGQRQLMRSGLCVAQGEGGLLVQGPFAAEGLVHVEGLAHVEGGLFEG